MASHEEVAAAWAAQQDKHHTGHHMFWEGHSIYSYGEHFKIARIHTISDGGQVALFTDRSCSNSTSKHQSYARRAWNGDMFTVPNVDAMRFDEHAGNIAAMVVAASTAAIKSKRARTFKLHHIATACEKLQEAGSYAEMFDIDLAKVVKDSSSPIKTFSRAEVMRYSVETSPEFANALMSLGLVED